MKKVQDGVTPAMLNALAGGMGLEAGSPEAIERSELAGQAELAQLMRALPIKSNLDVGAVTAQTGIVFGEPIDELFVSVVLPAGWEIKPSNHSMYSDLVDESGKVRAEIFYKAAFYDRKANIRWINQPGAEE